MDKPRSETSSEKTWGALAEEAIHSPYVDIAISAAVGAAVVLSRGKLAGAAERLFPKSSALLDEAGEDGLKDAKGAVATVESLAETFDSGKNRWVPSKGLSTDMRTAHEALLAGELPTRVETRAAAVSRDILKMPPWQRGKASD
jgi:hypothetical protein